MQNGEVMVKCDKVSVMPGKINSGDPPYSVVLRVNNSALYI